MASAQDTDHLAVTADVADPDSVTALFDRIESTFGRLDLLFNNAGAASPPVAFDEITVEDWQRVVAVNLTGSFLCARAAFSLMKRQSPSGGRIINNGSVSAHTPPGRIRLPTPPPNMRSRV